MNYNHHSGSNESGAQLGFPSQVPLTARDVSNFLRAMARVADDPVTGNPLLAVELLRLVKVLNAYGDEPANRIISGLTLRKSQPRRMPVRRPSPFQTMNMSSLELGMVKKMLQDERLTKIDLVRLGFERFGISKSRLARQNREASIKIIESALGNEEALDIISQEAKREGGRRTS